MSSFVLGSLGVPHHHVGVCSGDDPTFPGIQIVDPGRVGAGHRHETVLVHFASDLETKADIVIGLCSAEAMKVDGVNF